MFGSRIRQSQPQDLDGTFKTLRRLRLRFIAAGIVYVVLALFMKSNGLETVTPLGEISGIRYSFYALALGLGILLGWLSNNYLAPRGSGDQMLQRLRISAFVVFFISEFSILPGLIIFFLTETMIDLYILSTYAFILLAVFFPRYSTWHEHDQREAQSTFQVTQETVE